VQELTDCVLCTKQRHSRGRQEASAVNGTRLSSLAALQPAGVTIVESAFPRLASAAGNELCRRRPWRSGSFETQCCRSRQFQVHPGNLGFTRALRIDLGSAEFKANAHRHMAEWARRRPFYVLGNGPPQVVVGRYADVHRVFSETETFKSEMPRGSGWEQFNKIMFAQFVTQMDGVQHSRVRRLLMPAFSSRRIEQLQDSITRIVDGPH
jgi:hypothetical protein